ncbi:MAG: DUF3467 domain-containing protein, partial [Gammaproteobacteria bacterium]|nr:DUF3467 domain-containing protein [Gammaproteobacteria bacterium]
TDENKKTYTYSNFVRAGFNSFEFVIEFGMHYEGDEDPHYHSRIVMHPDNINELLRVLNNTYEEYLSNK